jgi:S-DNA-T family DNA segregation ATPase FtsK/SpoIIIE
VAPLRIEDVAPTLTSRGKLDMPQDPLMETARQLFEEHKHVSTSYLQRKLSIGYPRAARIMERLREEQTTDEEEEGDKDD